MPDTVLPPHSEEAEMAVLGSMLIDPLGTAQITTFLKPEHFYVYKHGWIYQAIGECGEHADLLTVGEALARRGLLDEVGGAAYLAQLTTETPTALNAVRYARLVEEYAARRAQINAASEIAKLAYDQAMPLERVITGAAKALDAAYRPQVRAESRAARDVFAAFFEAIERRHEKPEEAAGVPTGYTEIDKMLGGGYRKGELVIIAARPGMGKTSLLNGIASNATGLNTEIHLSRQFSVAYYSMEMSAEQLCNRFTAMDTGIDSSRISNGHIRDDEWTKLSLSIMRHCDAPLFINDQPQTVRSMQDDAERIKARYGLDLVIADYLGLFNEPGDAYERVSRIARDLKNAAKYLSVPVVCAAQLSRSCESRKDRHPELSDLRDSGEIEQAADIVQFIYRDEYYNADTEFAHIADIDQKKNRNGATGRANLYFNKELTKFSNLALKVVKL